MKCGNALHEVNGGKNMSININKQTENEAILLRFGYALFLN